MVSTPNYQLIQPVTTDFVDVVSHLDDNWTKIDQDMNRFDTQVFIATGTWTKPARCKRVMVEVQGAGGSAGGAAATGAAQGAVSGAGGGGGYSRKLFLASALSATETVTIGTGGAAAAAGNNNGNTGGASSFATSKAYVVTGNGGVLGAGAINSGASNGAGGGVGGTATGGDVNIEGGDGGNGVVIVNGTGVGGDGGGSYFAGRARYTTNTSNIGNPGKKYGGGSSSVSNGGSSGALGSTAGADGIVIVTNFY